MKEKCVWTILIYETKHKDFDFGHWYYICFLKWMVLLRMDPIINSNIEYRMICSRDSTRVSSPLAA